MTERNIRAVVQRLESLQRAGITHVKRRPAGAASAGVTGESPGACPATAGEPGDPRRAALAAVAREVAACTRCRELARTRTQTVFGVGNPYARLVFCGEAPGADEDRQGEPFVGRAGQLLTDIIVKGMKMRREDVYILNILRCRPPGNRNPVAGRSRQLPRVSGPPVGDHPAGVHLLFGGRGRAKSARR